MFSIVLFHIFQDGRHEKRTLRLRNGLITRHAYSVTGLARVRGQLGKNIFEKKKKFINMVHYIKKTFFDISHTIIFNTFQVTDI